MRWTKEQYEQYLARRRGKVKVGEPKDRSQANRGKTFEDLVRGSTLTYLSRGEICGLKVPTEVVVHWSGGKVSGAHFPEEPWGKVDFLVLWRGLALAFDAKSTRETTRFDLSLVDERQVRFLRAWQRQGGVSFLLIDFRILEEVWLYPFPAFWSWWDEQPGGRKSIPVESIRTEGVRVTSGHGVIVDYLTAVEHMFGHLVREAS